MRIMDVLGVLAIVLCGSATVRAGVPTVTESASLTGPANVDYAFDIDASGERIVVGAELAAPAGAAYVYEFLGGSWVETATLTPSAPGINLRFGSAVAIDGDRILVCARLQLGSEPDSKGVGYLFDYDQGTSSWVETQQVSVEGTVPSGGFGMHCDLQGDRLLIAGRTTGSVGVFRHTGSWAHEAWLTPDPGPGVLCEPGTSLCLDGNRVLFGDPHYAGIGGETGAAFLFEYDQQGDSWSQSLRLEASDASAGAQFGKSVGLSGDSMWVGASGAGGSGAVYAFRDQGGWSESQVIVSFDLQPGDGFGWSLALEGDRAVVGALGARAAYTFRDDGATWSAVTKLDAETPPGGSQLGNDVAFLAQGTVVADRAFASGGGTGEVLIYDDPTTELVIEVLASVPDPQRITVSPDGTLYVGRESGSTPSSIHQVTSTGVVTEFGPAQADPDAVLYVPAGTAVTPVAGAGTVLVGGRADGSANSGYLDAVDAVSSLAVFPSTSRLDNPTDMVFDSTGRLLILDASRATQDVKVSTGGEPTTLLSLGGVEGRRLDVGPGDVLYVSDLNGRIRTFDSNGSPLDDRYATDLGVPALAVGTGGYWSQDLFVIATGGPLGGSLLRFSGPGVATVEATGFGGSSYDMVFGPDGRLYVSDHDGNAILRITPGGTPVWSHEGCALAGLLGEPLLVGIGPLTGNSFNELILSQALPDSPAGVVVATSSVPSPFAGGTLKPLFLFMNGTDGEGSARLPFYVPPTFPSGAEIWAQWLVLDPGAVEGIALSNAVRGLSP